MAKNNQAFEYLFIIAAFSLVFPLEVPIVGVGSAYASVNTIDFIIFFIVSAAVSDTVLSSEDFTITLPQVTIAIAIISGWIVTTTIVALLRSPVSIQASSLWVIKWFEGVVLFLLAQNYLSPKAGKRIFRGLLFGGIILSIIIIFSHQISGGYRARLFFDNPNTLSVFLNLIIIVGVSLSLKGQRDSYVLSIGTVALGGAALVLTGSRSGILGLAVGIISIFVLARGRFSRYTLTYLTTGGAFLFLLSSYLAPERLLERLTGWIVFKNGSIMLTDTIAARSFRTRLRLADKAVELFLQQPIFGYGWYASPSRIGYLDSHFPTLLAEIGLIGLILIVIFYITIFQAWIVIKKYNIIGVMGGAWFISLLIQSVGGNFPRTPQILFILLLFLAAAKAITQEDIERGDHQMPK